MVEIGQAVPWPARGELVLEDGTIIYDSLVICTYFDTVFAPGKLIPIAWPARLAALRRHALGNGTTLKKASSTTKLEPV